MGQIESKYVAARLKNELNNVGDAMLAIGLAESDAVDRWNNIGSVVIDVTTLRWVFKRNNDAQCTGTLHNHTQLAQNLKSHPKPC